MSGGGNRRANGERGAEKSMDEYLKSLGLHRKSIAKDGSCLFRCVAEQVRFSQSLHTRIRAQCVEFLREHRDNYEAFIEGDFEEYLCTLLDPKQWVGEVEINALSLMYKRDFLIFHEPGKPAVNITGNKFEDKVQLCFLNGNHYDSVYEVNQMKNAALCQSILYELLYEKVFAVDHAALVPCLRANRTAQFVSDDNMALCVSSDDSDMEVPEAPKEEKDTMAAAPRHSGHSCRGRGRGRLPERVRRSLNPSLFRNVEYDVWQKSLKAQQKRDFCIAAGMHYSVGDHCQADVEGKGRYCHVTIKEIHADMGQATVETDNLGQVRVPLWSLQSGGAPRIRAGTREKKPANGHEGEWEERRRGRGRGRGGTASSAPSAPAPGPAGRTLKQHSWPGPTAAEDRVPRVSRSSSEVEPVSFGLTEVERLAKQEAEKNVALVEIHLRDEKSFPSLSSNSTKNSGERKQSQRRNTKSPVESPTAGEGRNCSSPPVGSTPTDPNRAAPSPGPDENSPTGPDPVKVATPKVASHSLSNSVGAALDLKTSNVSRNTKAVSGSLAPLKPASLPSPTFIAPIAPDPAAALGFQRSTSQSPLPHSPSPPALISPSTERLPSGMLGGASASPRISDVVGSQARESNARLLTQSESAVTCSSPVPPAELPAVMHPPNEEQVALPNQNQPPTPPVQNQNSAPFTQTQPVDDPVQPHGSSEEEVGEHQNRIPEAQIQPGSPQSPDPLNQSALQGDSNPPDVQYHSLVAQTEPDGHALDPGLPEQPYQTQMAPVPLDISAQQEQPPSGSTLTHLPVEQNQTPTLLPRPEVQGGVPLQELSQLFQDPLYPGFPQEPNGNMAPTPPYSSMKSGEDLPRDVNILRFFFNLGLKAFKYSMIQPGIYLLPLQQAFNLQLHPHSSSAGFLHAISPSEHQEAYQPQQHQFISPQYSPQVAPQSLPAEPSNPSESARYPGNQPPTHIFQGSLLPKRQRSPSYPEGYAAQNQYPDSQVYQRGGQGVYSPVMPAYAPLPHHYPSPNPPGEPQGAAEQSFQMNGASILGLGPSPASGPETSAAGFLPLVPRALKNEPSGMRVQRVEQNHQPPVCYTDVTMTTIPRSSNTPGSPAHYFVSDKSVTVDTRHSFPHQPTKTYTTPKSYQGGPGINPMTAGFCPEENWCKPGGVTSMTWSNQTAKRGPRSRGGRRGRGGSWRNDSGSGYGHFNAYLGRGQNRQ